MTIDICGIDYRLKLGDVPEGELAHVSHTACTIMLSANHSPRHLPLTLAHEVAHAIILHTPPPPDPYSEQYADWLGAQMLLFHRRLSALGGIEALTAAAEAAGAPPTE